MVHVDGVGLVDLADEELVVSQKLLRVNGGLIQEHASDDTGDLVSKALLDGGINAISNEVLSIFALDVVEVGQVNWGQLKEILLLLLLLVVVGLLVASFLALFVIAILLLATLMTLVLL